MDSKFEKLDCKFTAQIKKQNGRHVVEIPASEIEYGTLSGGDICQVSIHKTHGRNKSEKFTYSENQHPDPPVTEGERETVEIEDLGEQGDGIARVNRGYVLIVPDTEVGDEVEVEIIEAGPNYGFAHRVDTDG